MNPATALVLLVAMVLMAVLGLAVLGMILRFAVWLTNKVVGGRKPVDPDLRSWEVDEQAGAGLAIPMPSLGRAMVILLVIGIVDGIVGAVLLVAANGGHFPSGRGTVGLYTSLVLLAVRIVVETGLLSSLLPTSLPRAAGVLFICWMFLLAPAVLIVALTLHAPMSPLTGR